MIEAKVEVSTEQRKQARQMMIERNKTREKYNEKLDR